MKTILFLGLFLMLTLTANAQTMNTVQTKTNTRNSVTSITATFDSNVTNGNFVFVAVTDPFGRLSGVSDNQGNTYTNIPATGQAKIYYAKNVTGGALTVTATFSSSTLTTQIIIREYSGVSDVDIYKTQNPTDEDTDYSLSTDTATNYSNELIVGVLTAGSFGAVTSTMDDFSYVKSSILLTTLGQIAIANKTSSTKEVQTVNFFSSTASDNISIICLIGTTQPHGFKFKGKMKFRKPVSGGLKFR